MAVPPNKGKHTCRCLVVAASTLNSSARGRGRDEHALPPPRTVEQPQACSSISRELHGGTVEPRQTHLHVPGRGGKHSPLKCQRQRRARTLSPPLPSVGSCMAAPPNKGKANTPARAWSWRQALSTQVPEAETSTHFESASYRGAAASY